MPFRLAQRAICALCPAVRLLLAVCLYRAVFFPIRFFTSVIQFQRHAPVAFSFLALILLQS